jgi:polysulfide reductase chain C
MKMNPQNKWGWEIAFYLFLAGLGGGAYVAGVIADFSGWETTISKTGVFLGLPCVAIGCVFLLFDLGSPMNFWRAAMRPSTSWMARGTIIIVVFMIINAIHIGFWIWPFAGVLENAVGARQFIGVLGMIFAFATMIYTGILLGAARPIAFWATAMLPLLFLVSALSTGFMATILFSSMRGVEHDQLAILSRVDMLMIILEMFVVSFFLQATHRLQESRASAELVLRGAASGMFWFGVVILGLLLPLILEMIGGGAQWAAILAPICGIIGGLLLRKVVLAGGIHAPLMAGRFEFAIPNT